jgi:hypothetical protein
MMSKDIAIFIACVILGLSIAAAFIFAADYFDKKGNTIHEVVR